MLTSLTEVIISLMISILSPTTTGQNSEWNSNDLGQFSPNDGEKHVNARPVEALGGGFKKL